MDFGPTHQKLFLNTYTSEMHCAAQIKGTCVDFVLSEWICMGCPDFQEVLFVGRKLEVARGVEQEVLVELLTLQAPFVSV